MYARGSNVSSSRARPTKPIDDSGSSASVASAMPSPARSTGTISGGLASRVPCVGATGVWTSNVSTAKERAASYTIMVVSSCSAARKAPESLPASRIAVSRDWANGWSTTSTSTRTSYRHRSHHRSPTGACRWAAIEWTT